MILLENLKAAAAFKRVWEYKHRLTFPRTYPTMKRAVERYKACTTRKSGAQIRKELRLCKAYWGCYPLHYFRYDLYRSDCVISEEQLLNYVPEYFFYDLFLPCHNSRKYAVLTDDKNVTDLMFRALDIRQPKTLCKLVSGHLRDGSLRFMAFESLRESLASGISDKVFVKPLDGSGGYGIHVFRRTVGGQYINRSEQVLNEALLDKLAHDRDYIIQWGIQQRPELSAIYPNSVNTLRIATQNTGGQVRILCSTLRMGRRGKEVDNSAQGGIIGVINTDTGAFGVRAGTEGCEYFAAHPDTNFVFAGASIPDWDHVRSFVLESARKFPFLTYLGWDIASSQEGPLAIEVNAGFGIDHYQVVLGGLRTILGIDNPGLYWKSRRIAKRAMPVVM